MFDRRNGFGHSSSTFGHCEFDVGNGFQNADWFEEAGCWIIKTLAQQAVTVSGPVEQVHVRPWSTVLRVPTDGGDLYFKACAPVLSHEAAVTRALFSLRTVFVSIENTFNMNEENPFSRILPRLICSPGPPTRQRRI